MFIGAQTADELTKEVNSALSPDPSRAVCQTGKGDAGRWKQPNNNKECEEAGSCQQGMGGSVLSPPKRCSHTLTPGICEHEIIWEKGLCK